MILEPINEGTVIHLNFSDLYGHFGPPEMIGPHPALVLTPKERQRETGTMIVVPLTSVEANESNPHAIEILSHEALRRANKKSDRNGSARSFALCNLPVAIAVGRPGVSKFTKDGKSGSNHQPGFRISGAELDMIQMAVYRLFFRTEKHLETFLKNEFDRIWSLLEERLSHSREQKKKAGAKNYEKLAFKHLKSVKLRNSPKRASSKPVRQRTTPPSAAALQVRRSRDASRRPL